MKNQDLHEIVAPLLSWYEEHARDLPWRENTDPYRVWISEIMLQQTRVEAGKEYYRRFLTALPDLASLAKVSDEKLLKLWEGLGYYSRARNLKNAAIMAMEQYGGQLPDTFEGLLSMPGIGSYTAGAIGSIAFGLQVPAVDGNVLRVISRLTASEKDITDSKTKIEMEQTIRLIIPQDRPGDFNQALMELGATICLPNGAPRCEACPLEKFCGAKEGNLQTELPKKAQKKKRKIEERTLLIIRWRDKIFLRKRKEKGLLAGMWEIPGLEGHLSAEQVQHQLKNQWGWSIRGIEPLHKANHIFTHIEWHMTAYRVEIETTELQTEQLLHEKDWSFMTEQVVEQEIALPSAFRSYRAELFS